MKKNGKDSLSTLRTRDYCLLGALIIAGIVFYTLNATKSGLWFDEAVEYFCSKVMVGSIPGDSETGNMFQRIRGTYQPPLYNILMYLWLTVFDSEFTFRLAGILVTMVGAAGCYFAINEALSNTVWSVIGTAFYIFTPGVVSYGLECAEYNLMLCLLTWTVFFFLRTLNRKDTGSMAGFFVFSSLSVYSQYGAVFFVVGMYIALFAGFLKNREYTEVKKMAIMTGITFVVAVIPLLFLFLLPQMFMQGSALVSHKPYFENGFFLSLLKGGKKIIQFLFGNKTGYGIIPLALICCISTFIRPKKMMLPVVSMVITGLLYFIAVCCSMYGYTDWNPTSVGSMNLGDRYSLFLIPGTIVVLVMGMAVFADLVKEKLGRCYKVLLGIFIVGIAVYCFAEIHSVTVQSWKKDDVRELVTVWFDSDAPGKKTLIHNMDVPLFYYYFIHDKRQENVDTGLIEAAEPWIQSSDYDEIKAKLGEMGYLSQDEYYCITPGEGKSEVLLSVLRDAGYSIEKVYSGKTLLIRLTR